MDPNIGVKAGCDMNYSDMSPSDLLQLAKTLMARADEILDSLEAKCDQIEARELAEAA
jgi:hypothetical protein